MKLDLAERVVIVTGGSSGIGYVIAREFAKDGARVVITARNRDALQKAATTLSSESGGEVTGIASDATDQKKVDEFVAQVVGRHARVDVLVNCAASPAGEISTKIEELDTAALRNALDVKVVGYTRFAKAVTPVMRRQRSGRIINIGGLTAREPQILSGLRNVAICHLSKALSDQLGPDGITVNTVHPGLIKTAYIAGVFAAEAKETGRALGDIEAAYVAETPTRRFTEMEEVATTVKFLASAAAASITGESIAVDGGITRGIYI